MLSIDEFKTIHITVGDVGAIEVSAVIGDDGYVFAEGDVVRFSVYEKGNYDKVMLQKDTAATAGASSVNVQIPARETCFCGLINKPKDFWYDIELNPETAPQTLVGYDRLGPKVFRLYPGGGVEE